MHERHVFEERRSSNRGAGTRHVRLECMGRRVAHQRPARARTKGRRKGGFTTIGRRRWRALPSWKEQASRPIRKQERDGVSLIRLSSWTPGKLVLDETTPNGTEQSTGANPEPKILLVSRADGSERTWRWIVQNSGELDNDRVPGDGHVMASFVHRHAPIGKNGRLLNLWTISSALLDDLQTRDRASCTCITSAVVL
eukprot:scaffold291_cov332-Pavlova_lutheri.AAC.9